MTKKAKPVTLLPDMGQKLEVRMCEKCDMAFEECKRILDSGLEKYEKTVEIAQKEYKNAFKPYLRELEKNIETLLEKYEKIVEPVWEEYAEVRDSAWEDYMVVRGQCTDKNEKLRTLNSPSGILSRFYSPNNHTADDWGRFDEKRRGEIKK